MHLSNCTLCKYVYLHWPIRSVHVLHPYILAETRQRPAHRELGWRRRITDIFFGNQSRDLKSQVNTRIQSSLLRVLTRDNAFNARHRESVVVACDRALLFRNICMIVWRLVKRNVPLRCGYLIRTNSLFISFKSIFKSSENSFIYHILLN